MVRKKTSNNPKRLIFVLIIICVIIVLGALVGKLVFNTKTNEAGGSLSYASDVTAQTAETTDSIEILKSEDTTTITGTMNQSVGNFFNGATLGGARVEGDALIVIVIVHTADVASDEKKFVVAKLITKDKLEDVKKIKFEWQYKSSGPGNTGETTQIKTVEKIL